jgi:hypothetical protein
MLPLETSPRSILQGASFSHVSEKPFCLRAGPGTCIAPGHPWLGHKVIVTCFVHWLLSKQWLCRLTGVGKVTRCWRAGPSDAIARCGLLKTNP